MHHQEENKKINMMMLLNEFPVYPKNLQSKVSQFMVFKMLK